MRRSLALGFAAVVALVAIAGLRPAPVAAHPLGNFTINRYARVELNADGVRVRYVIDMAEIPSFAETPRIDADKDGVLSDGEKQAYANQRAMDYAANLKLEVNGSAIRLTPGAASVTLPEGQAGLTTIRFVADYSGALPDGWEKGVRASLRDENFSDRLGWKEIVIQPGAGVALQSSSVAVADVSQELTAYPQERLKSPLDVREASFTFAAGDPSELPRTSQRLSGKTSAEPAKSGNGFARLISRENLSPAFIALSLLAAIAWGAAHALGPGHGKTIVAAYLVGERGTAKHAVILGLTVTITHTSTVITLGLVTLYASRFIATEDLYLWLSVGSGVLVVLMGLLLFVSRYRSAVALGRRRSGLRERTRPFGLAIPPHPAHAAAPVGAGKPLAGAKVMRTSRTLNREPHSHSHSHGHAVQAHNHAGASEFHSHDDGRSHEFEHEDGGYAYSHDDGHGHGHSHLPPAPGLRGLIALGISGGLLPCPTALVVMLAAIALDRIAYGLVLIFAFSLGLAGVLTAVGILLVYARRAMDGEGRFGSFASRLRVPALVFQVAPMVSAVVITVAGLILTTNAISAL